MTTLTDLERRLASAKEGSRELDHAIYEISGGAVIPWRNVNFMMQQSWRALPEHDGFIGATNTKYLPFYTSDLSAAVALAEAVLPGVRWQIGRFNLKHDRCDAQIALPTMTEFGEGIGVRAQAYAPTPALALCLAIVRALIAKGDK